MKKLIVKISTAGGGTPFMRQAPSGVAVWDKCEFLINKDTDECDLWVVYGGLGKDETVRARHTLFVSNEPPTVKRYSAKFLQQFDTVMTCKQSIKHPHVIYNQQALPWLVGHNFRDDAHNSKTYDELTSIKEISKTKRISVITSNKTFTKGHRARVSFVQKLQQEFGDMIDVFGIDKQVDDKWDAIAPYKYHIVIENASLDDYWTEKLADAFLGLSFPIYYGAPNITTYFASDSLVSIDITKPDQALRTIRELVASDRYEHSIPALQIAKTQILDTYQLFPMLARYAQSLDQKAHRTITLAPERESGIVRYVKRLYRYVKRF